MVGAAGRGQPVVGVVEPAIYTEPSSAGASPSDTW